MAVLSDDLVGGINSSRDEILIIPPTTPRIQDFRMRIRRKRLNRKLKMIAEIVSWFFVLAFLVLISVVGLFTLSTGLV